MFAAAGRSVQWSTRAQIGPRWRAGEAFGARWGGGAGALDTTGPTRQRGLRARSRRRGGGLVDARLDKANAAGVPWSTQRRAYGGPAKVRRRARYPRTVDDLPNLIETCRRLLVGQKLALDDDYHYAHLPLCVIDSVFSIGVRYGGVTRSG